MKFKVRTYECDSYNHANNAVYLNYLEFARYEFLKDIQFDYNALISKGFGVFVARVEIDYKHPAKAGEELTIETRIIKKGAFSVVFAQKIMSAARAVAEAKVKCGFVDEKGLPARMPPEFDLPGLLPDA